MRRSCACCFAIGLLDATGVYCQQRLFTMTTTCDTLASKFWEFKDYLLELEEVFLFFAHSRCGFCSSIHYCTEHKYVSSLSLVAASFDKIAKSLVRDD